MPLSSHSASATGAVVGAGARVGGRRALSWAHRDGASARDGAVWITLNRPAALNSLTPDMVTGIDRALDRAEADDVKAVVLTGSGRAFCAGADLKAFAGLNPQQAAEIVKAGHEAAID